ncbi:flagellar hook-associated protein 2 [Actinoplanes sp. NBRC 101535]|nr:flagellar hook-associated protein 2 [Actinoplanes sp. NBRC 101535]
MITSLMQVEAAPQNRLKSKVKTAETTVASYQSVNSKLNSLKTAADDLGQLSTWRAVKANSSSSTVKATATGGTNSLSGSTTFDVIALAKAQISTAQVPAGANITDTGTIQITIGNNAPIDITTTDQTPAGVAAAINGTKNLGIRAGVVTTADGNSVLQLTSTKTGTDNAFTVAGLNTDLTDVATASDARLRVGAVDGNGDLTPGSYEMKSSSNTFTGVMSGVSVTVSKLETGVTIDAQSDVESIAAKFQAMVDAANATLTDVRAQTAYDPSTRIGSPLTGDFMVRQISQNLLSAVSGGLSYDNPKYVAPADGGSSDTTVNPPTIAYGSLAQFGIALDRTGKLTFDASKFATTYAADPVAVQEAGTALAGKFETMAGEQSSTVTAVILGRNNEIDNFNTQINDWDVRLAAKKEALQKTYADLETALGKLKNQSSWLSGQLAGLG